MNWLPMDLSSKELKKAAILAASQFPDFHEASAEVAMNSLPENLKSDIYSLIRLARDGRWMDGAIKEIESKLPTGSIEERYLLVSTVNKKKEPFESRLFKKRTSEHWKEEYVFHYMVTGNFEVVNSPDGGIGGDFKFIFFSKGIFASFPIQLDVVNYQVNKKESDYNYPCISRTINSQEEWKELDLAALVASKLF